MKSFFSLSLIMFSIFSLSAQSIVKEPKTEVETHILTKLEIQQKIQKAQPQLFAERKKLESQLNQELSKQERAAIEKRLEAVNQNYRNNERILEGKAVQLGQDVRTKN